MLVITTSLSERVGFEIRLRDLADARSQEVRQRLENPSWPQTQVGPRRRTTSFHR